MHKRCRQLQSSGTRWCTRPSREFHLPPNAAPTSMLCPASKVARDGSSPLPWGAVTGQRKPPQSQAGGSPRTHCPRSSALCGAMSGHQPHSRQQGQGAGCSQLPPAPAEGQALGVGATSGGGFRGAAWANGHLLEVGHCPQGWPEAFPRGSVSANSSWRAWMEGSASQLRPLPGTLFPRPTALFD